MGGGGRASEWLRSDAMAAQLAETYIPAAASASLLPNNCTCSPAFLAFAHINQVVVVDLEGDAGSRCEAATGSPTIHSLRYLDIAGTWVLVVGVSNGSQFFSEDGRRVLGSVQSPHPSVDGSIVAHRGACVRATESGGHHVLLGTTTNCLHVVQVGAGGASFNFLGSSTPSSENVMSECQDLCCFGHGAIASVHAQGEIVLWNCLGDGTENAESYMAIQTVLMAGVPTAIVPVLEYLAVASGQGTLRLYTWDLTLFAEVDLHGRWINGLDVNPMLGLLATCGEDTIVNIVRVDANGEISLPYSQASVDKLLTGACFLKSMPESVSLCVTAYDSATVAVLKA